MQISAQVWQKQLYLHVRVKTVPHKVDTPKFNMEQLLKCETQYGLKEKEINNYLLHLIPKCNNQKGFLGWICRLNAIKEFLLYGNVQICVRA